jgi:prepilin-type N-terminal cleavage/methylation domain-containing protein
MKIPRFSLIGRSQRGFTLIELLIAVAITGAITGGLAMSIFQTFDYSARGNARMTCVKQVENAVHWLSRDAQMAQVMETDELDPDGFPLTLTWTEWDNTRHQATYFIDGSELKRSHVEDGIPLADYVVARYVADDPALTNCSFSEADRVLTFEITAVVTGYPEDVSETREVKITPRTS